MKRSAELRLALARINPRFWHIHPDADSRFDAWMRRSLTLKDREPIAPLLVPADHEIAGVGVIDDFYDKNLADISTLSNGGLSGESLLEAPEDAFARRAVDSVLVVCPAAWSSKVTWLSRRGYQVAKLWMLKS